MIVLFEIYERYLQKLRTDYLKNYFYFEYMMFNPRTLPHVKPSLTIIIIYNRNNIQNKSKRNIVFHVSFDLIFVVTIINLSLL